MLNTQSDYLCWLFARLAVCATLQIQALQNYYNALAKLETLSCNEYYWPRACGS
jgi:hypothetical protein